MEAKRDKPRPMQWTWKYADWLVVIIAVLVGFCIWFIPNEKANKNYQELKRVNAERRAELVKQAQAAAAEADHKKMVEEYGLVYVPMPSQLQPDTAPGKNGAPAKKPAAKTEKPKPN